MTALEARKAVLESELAAKARERDEAARMLDQARVVAGAEAAFDRGPEWQARRHRRRGRIVQAVVALAFVAGGVFAYHATRPTKPSAMQRIMAELEVFTDAMCQCRDSACAARVSDDLTRWGTRMAREAKPPAMTEKEAKRAAEIGKRMGECMERAM